MKTILCGILASIVSLSISASTYASIIYLDDFEGESLVESGNPPGWAVFGNPIDDKGTYTTTAHSPSASVWVAFTWTGWGWGTTTDAGDYDVGDASSSMSVWLQADSSFAAQSVALTIYDADGTQWRTADANLFQPNTSWGFYQTTLSDMVVEAAGTTPGLDFQHISQFGLLAYTAEQSGSNQMQFDDFSVQTIPEPTSMALLLLGTLLIDIVRRRHN